MRKSFKKGMAMLLAAAMVFSTPGALEKTTAKAAAELTPVAEYDFASSEGITIDNKTAADKAFTIADGVLTMTDSGNSATIANPLKGKATTAAVIDFDFEIASDAVGPNIEFGTIVGFQTPNLALSPMPYFCYNGGEGGPGFVDLKGTSPKAGEKHHYTCVINNKGVEMYIDGMKTALNQTGVSDAAFTPDKYGAATLKGINESDEVYFGKGAFWGAAAGKLDNVKFYNADMDASQVYKLVTGKDAVVDGLLGDVAAELSKDGKSINLKYNTKMSIPADDLSISVNGKVVATGSAVSASPVSGAATYVYTPEEDGEYKLAVSAKEQTLDGKLYLAQEKTVSITVVKDGNRFYVKDDTLFTGFGVAKTTTDKVFKVNWTPAAGVTATATVKGPDGKTVGNPLTAPGNVTVSAAGEYTVDIVAKKGSSIKKDTAKFTYKAAATPAPGKTDKFSKITTKPLYKYTFDDAKEVTLSAKAKVEGGVLKLAPTAGKHGEYYAKIDSMTADDFSKGITFIADVNVAAVGKNSTGAYQDWTPFVIFGDGTPAKKDAAGATYRWAITQGFSSKAGTSKDYHAAGYYGNEIKAPYTWDYFNTAANRGKWYTIAVTVKKNEMITYINGVQVQKGTADYSVILDGMKKSNNNYLGASYWDADDDFAGSMDDVAVYNTALSAADVKTLNRSGTGGTGTVTPPTGGTDTAKVSKVSITVPNRKAGKTVYMKKGDKVTLKATVKGSGKYSKSVTWKTSKKSVATVSSKGKVTAKKAGTAKITATSKTDKSKKATITIKVSKKAVKNKTLKISPTKKTLKKGKSLTIKIKKITKKTTDKITYKSSKKSVATVDAYGKVKAKKKGKATITVKCGKKSAKLKLTVKK